MRRVFACAILLAVGISLAGCGESKAACEELGGHTVTKYELCQLPTGEIVNPLVWKDEQLG